MLESTKKLTLLLLMLLLLSSKAFSQKTVLTDTGDTTICFSPTQAKFLLKAYYGKEKCLWDNNNLEQQKVLLTKTILASDSTITLLRKVINNKQSEAQFLTDQINEYDKQLKKSRRVNKLQKFTKWIYIVGSFAAGMIVVNATH